MATVLTSPRPTADARLDQELGKAAGRIRLNDLLAGVLTLVVLTLAYAAAAVVLDSALELSDRVRQLGLGLFAAACLVVGYFRLVRPLRRTVNPRFAARQVESTVPDAKNAVINWVDLRDEALPDGVRAAVSARAEEGVAGADVNRAVESRGVFWLAAAAGLLLATLAALFLVLKPAPFLSLVGRTFNPFAGLRIASKTELTVLDPAGGDATVTAGEPLTVRVHVGGRVPDPLDPDDPPDRVRDHVRLQVRHNPAAEEYDELPLEPGGSAREWVIELPPSVIQNGFWYRVVGGDAVTPEYRVAVRSRPLVRSFAAEYQHPAYTRMAPEVGREPRLVGYPGTQVTLTVGTNRRVASGHLRIDGLPDSVRGEVVGEERDALLFKLTLTENRTYRIDFTSADGEASEPTLPYPIRVLADRPPTVTVNRPAEEEISLPPNGLLAVDGAIGDDFGITAAALVVQVEGEKEPLPAKPYRAGKPLRREADGTFPTTLEYKDSVPLAGLKDAGGQPVQLKPGVVLRYWVEATDNRSLPTAPKGQVGKSAERRVVIGEPVTAPQKQDEQARRQQERQADEKAHQAKQDEQLQTEKREPPPPVHQDQPKDADPAGKPEGQPPAGQDGPGAKPEAAPQPRPEGTGPEPMTPPPTPPMGGMTDPSKPTTPPEAATPPDAPKDKPQPKEPPPDQKVKDQADAVQKAIDEQNRQPGQARGEDPGARQPGEPPAEPKKGTPPPEPEPKPGQPADPAGEPPAEARGGGTADTTQPGEPKPEPKPGEEPTGTTPKPAPVGGDPAREKPAAEPRPTGPKEPEAGAGRGAEPKSVPEAATPKPRAEPPPGREQPTPQPPAGSEPTPEERAGGARGEKPVEPSAPKKPQGAPGEEDAARPKPSPADPTQPEGQPGAGRPGTPGDTARKGTEKPPPREPGELSRETGRDEGPAGPADEDIERLRRDADDLASNDPGKRQQAEKKFDDLLSKKERERLQQGVKDASDPTDPKKQERAKQDVDELSKKAAKNEMHQPSPEEIQKAAEKARDLTSPDPAKREAAEKEFDNAVGKEQRQQMQQDLKDLQSGDPDKQQAAQQRLEDAAKQAAREQKADAGRQPTREEIDRLKQKAEDLTSADPQKREAAEKEFDNAVGKDKREQLQKDLQDLKSGDPNKQKAAQERAQKAAEQMAKDAAGQKQPSRQPSKEEIEKARQLAEDLASDDPQKRQAAEKQLDQSIGQQKREQLQKDLQDLKSGDTDKQKAAQERLQKAAEQMAKDAKAAGRQPSKEEMDRVKEKLQDLASDDPQKRQAAEKQFDDAIGKEKREQLQQAMKDARSGDPEKQKAAKEKLEQMAKEAAGGQKPQPRQPTREEIDRAKQIAEDLASDDPQKRQAAEKQFDDAVGKEKREQLQQAMKDMKSGDPQRQKAAREKLDQMAQEAAGKENPPRPPTKEEQEQWAKQAEDLTSPDEGKREAAEKAFDEAMGQQAREQLQKDLQDLKSDDPGKQEAARKRLEEMAKKLPPPSDRPNTEFRPGGGGGKGQDGEPYEDNPANRLKTAELQLKSFEKNKQNEELLKKLGYTPEEYEKFLEGYRQMVARQREELEKQAQSQPEPQPTGPATVRVGEGSDNKKLEHRPDKTADTTGGAGPGTAPPGYSEAQRRFADEARKLKKGEKK